MRLFVVVALVILLACVAHAGVTNGDFSDGLNGWMPGDGLADWWIQNDVLVAHTRSKQDDSTWLINDAILPAGTYLCRYDVSCPYGESIQTVVSIGIGLSQIAIDVGNNSSVTYTTELTTSGGQFRFGVWTQTDSIVYIDNISVDAIPEAPSLVLLSVGSVMLFGLKRRTL